VTKETAAHSPLPWRWQGNRYFFELVDSAGKTVADDGSASGEYLGWFKSDDRSPDANAHFIVLACNAYDDMLAALKHAAANMPHPDQMIDDAIAKAEGR
jgi:hypothetical protein